MKFGRIISSIAFLLFSLILITLIGAYIFVRLEANNELILRIQTAKAKQKIFVTAQKLASSTNGDSDWHQLVDQVDAYKDRLQAAWAAGTDEMSQETQPKWTYSNAIYFCVTIFTTIGYGNLVPSTNSGKIFSVIFGLISIPLFGVILSRVASQIARIVKAIYLMTLEARIIPIGLKDAYRRADTNFDYSFISCYGFLIGYLAIGSGIYSWLLEQTSEIWTPTDSVYFAFASITTIGFGDLVPERDSFFSVFSGIYLIIGLAIGTLTIGRMNEIFSQRLEYLSRPIDQSIDQLHISRFSSKKSKQS